MDILEFLKVIVFGIVEGFAEWLPISSTGHLIIINDIIPMNVSVEFQHLFMVVIQLGAILAVVVLFFHKLNPFTPSKSPKQKRAVLRLWLKILVACIPVGVVGLLFGDWMQKHLSNSYVVSAALIIYGVLFIAIEILNRGRKPFIDRPGQLSYLTALCIGGIQVLALVPGTSRSGVTILGAMLLGCSRGMSTEFSFFVAIPVLLGASLKKLIEFGFLKFTGGEVFYLILGTVVAFLVSLYSIKFLLGYIRRNSFTAFGIYRIGLGLVVLLYFGLSKLLA